MRNLSIKAAVCNCVAPSAACEVDCNYNENIYKPFCRSTPPLWSSALCTSRELACKEKGGRAEPFTAELISMLEKCKQKPDAVDGTSRSPETFSNSFKVLLILYYTESWFLTRVMWRHIFENNTTLNHEKCYRLAQPREYTVHGCHFITGNRAHTHSHTHSFTLVAIWSCQSTHACFSVGRRKPKNS